MYHPCFRETILLRNVWCQLEFRLWKSTLRRGCKGKRVNGGRIVDTRKQYWMENGLHDEDCIRVFWVLLNMYMKTNYKQSVSKIVVVSSCYWFDSRIEWGERRSFWRCLYAQGRKLCKKIINFLSFYLFCNYLPIFY